MSDPVPTQPPCIQITATIRWEQSHGYPSPRNDFSNEFTLQFFPVSSRRARGVTDSGADGALEMLLDEYDTTRLADALRALHFSEEHIASNVNEFEAARPIVKMVTLCNFDDEWVSRTFAYYGGVSHTEHASHIYHYCCSLNDNGLMFATPTQLYETMPWAFQPRDNDESPLIPICGAFPSPYDNTKYSFTAWASHKARREFDEYEAWANGEMFMPKVTFALPAPDLYPDAMKLVCSCCGNLAFDASCLLPSAEMDVPWYGFSQYDTHSADDGGMVWENLSAIEAFQVARNADALVSQIARHHRHGLCTDQLTLTVDVPLQMFPPWTQYISSKKDSITKMINELQAQLDVM